MSSDPNGQPSPEPQTPAQPDATPDTSGRVSESTAPAVSAGAEGAAPTPSSDDAGDDSPDSPKRRILIGSQRDPAAYRPKPRHEFESNRGRRGGRPSRPQGPRQGGQGGQTRRSGPPQIVSADTLADPVADVPLSESPFMPPVPPGGLTVHDDGSSYVIDTSSIPSTEPVTTFDAPLPPASRPPLAPQQPPRASAPPPPRPRPAPPPPRPAPAALATPATQAPTAPAPVASVPVAETSAPPAPIETAPIETAPIETAPIETAPVVSRPAMPQAYVSPDEPPTESPAALPAASAAVPSTPAQPEQRERFDRGRGRGDGDRRREGGQGGQGRRGGFREREEQRRREKEEARAAERAEMTVVKRAPTPSVRDRLSPDLEAEFLAAVGDVEFDALLTGQDSVTAQAALEPESRHAARVLAVHRDDVFVELGGREQGIVSLRLFTEPPKPEDTLEVVVVRFNAEDGLYELTLPNAAASVGDWSQISEGMVVEARVTGHNTGGLECEVSHLRGFIPVSQIALYRVQDLAEFVGQKFNCVVTEANPQRQNLVLSRRAVLEREKEEARANLLASLAPGQIFDGVVRKIMDFGAFVELGNGVDGLLHISEMGWGRVRHPSDVFHEGQGVRVRINKVDPVSGKIGLGYRDLIESPWTTAEEKFQPNTPAKGRVVKIMEFGAFVELEPGVEGLVHISELSHKRVARVSEVVKEGDVIDVMILSVDPQSRRISLSMKNLIPLPEEAAAAEESKQAAEAAPEPVKPKKPTGPLKGGLGRSTGGSAFGLKW